MELIKGPPTFPVSYFREKMAECGFLLEGGEFQWVQAKEIEDKGGKRSCNGGNRISEAGN